MNTLLIPAPDTIPAAWGWFQFFLLVTFPLHLLAMNAMLGGLVIGIGLQVTNKPLANALSHKIAIALPLVIAFAVNFGVAPLLFLQVLYGHFVYTSSILMGTFWLLVIPMLIIAYYGAYLYDFKYQALGKTKGILIGLVVLLLLLVIGYFFSNNMLMMSKPEVFENYFAHRGGSFLVSGEVEFMPRYLHMIIGALAIGGLSVAVLGRLILGKDDAELSNFAQDLGLRVFSWITLLNVLAGIWYLLSIKRETMRIFMGGDLLATIAFCLALFLVVCVLFTGFTKRLYATVAGAITLLYLMSFMRAWVRSDYLGSVFSLDTLTVSTQWSPLIFFVITLVMGVGVIAWMFRAVARERATQNEW